MSNTDFSSVFGNPAVFMSTLSIFKTRGFVPLDHSRFTLSFRGFSMLQTTSIVYHNIIYKSSRISLGIATAFPVVF
jgi:hypothetical protein